MKQTITSIYNWLDLAGFQFGDKSKLGLSLELIAEEVKELEDGNIMEDKFEIKDAIVDTFWVMCNNAYFNGITAKELSEMFNAVKRSNYSKFCTEVLEANQTCDAYEAGEHWDKKGTIYPCVVDTKEPYYIIKHAKTGKVLKSINYIPTKELMK